MSCGIEDFVADHPVADGTAEQWYHGGTLFQLSDSVHDLALSYG